MNNSSSLFMKTKDNSTYESDYCEGPQYWAEPVCGQLIIPPIKTMDFPLFTSTQVPV